MIMLYDYGKDQDGNATIVDKFSRKRVPFDEEQIILAWLEIRDLREKGPAKNEDTVQ